ncbi:hypothetical protein [Terrisporobacter sp.]
MSKNKQIKANKKAFRRNRAKRRQQKKIEKMSAPKGDTFDLLVRFSQFSALTKNNLKQLYEEDADGLFEQLLSNNYIKIGPKKVKINEEMIDYYKLTEKGKKFLKEKDYTIYFSNSARHDIIHATNVISQFKDFLNYYQHEKELDQPIYSGSKVDGAIVYEDTIIYIETITRSYSTEKIKQKRDYVRGRMNNAHKQHINFEYIEFDERRRYKQ